MKTRVIQEDFFPREELFPTDVLIMKNLGSLFAQACIVISLSPYIIKLFKLNFLSSPSAFKSKLRSLITYQVRCSSSAGWWHRHS